MSTEYSRPQPIAFNPTHLETLRARLQGRALVAGDEGYDTARQTWDARTFDQHPAIIVLPAVSSELVGAIILARAVAQANLSLSDEILGAVSTGLQTHMKQTTTLNE